MPNPPSDAGRPICTKTGFCTRGTSQSWLTKSWGLPSIFWPTIRSTSASNPSRRPLTSGSRLSTSSLRNASTDLGRINTLLDTHYALSGAYVALGAKVHISWELAETQSTQILVSDRVVIATEDLLTPDADFFSAISQRVQSAIIEVEVVRANRQPLPTLKSYSLLLAASSLMHRSSPQILDRSYEILNHLIDRHPKLAQPKAWLAKWYVLRSVYGGTSEPQREGGRALSLTQRAIDLDPGDSMSLAMQGHVYTHLLDNPDLAKERLEHAITVNPSDSLAWLYKSVVQAMWGDSGDAVTSAARALALSPIDPSLYYYHALHASALLADGQATEALAAAQESLRLNQLHLPTYRVLLTAQVMAGQTAAALDTKRRLEVLSPGFSLATYEKSGNIESRTKQQTILALKTLGNR